MEQGPTLVCNCLQIKAAADGSFAFSQQNTTPSFQLPILPGESGACALTPSMTDLSDREERSRAGGGEKGDLEDLQSSQEKMGMVECVSGGQSPWHGPGESGKVEVVPILGMETEK